MRRFGRIGIFKPDNSSTEVSKMRASFTSISTDTRRSPSSYANTVCCDTPSARAISACVMPISLRSSVMCLPSARKYARDSAFRAFIRSLQAEPVQRLDGLLDPHDDCRHGITRVKFTFVIGGELRGNRQ